MMQTDQRSRHFIRVEIVMSSARMIGSTMTACCAALPDNGHAHALVVSVHVHGAHVHRMHMHSITVWDQLTASSCSSVILAVHSGGPSGGGGGSGAPKIQGLQSKGKLSNVHRP